MVHTLLVVLFWALVGVIAAKVIWFFLKAIFWTGVSCERYSPKGWDKGTYGERIKPTATQRARMR